ncbi:MAG: glycosyltransferase family 4 protein [Phycisphaera sp.]|nr:glycosyltransferase family 4 protein [Phycisphaera sp.]
MMHHSDQSPISPRLEPVVVDWYRQALKSRLAQMGNGHAEPELEHDLEASLLAGSRPSERNRCRLADLGDRSAARHAEGRGTSRSRAAHLCRSLVRSLFGWSPHLCSPIDGVPGTRVLHAIGDLQIGGAQQLVIDLARSAPTGSRHRIVTRSVGIRFQPATDHAELPPMAEAMHREFDRFRPELLHVCHYHASILTRAWYRVLSDVATARGIPVVQSHCVIGDPLLRGDTRHLVFCSEWSRVRSSVPGTADSVISPGSPLEDFRAPRRTPSDTPVVGMVYRLDGDKIDSTTADVLRAILQASPRTRIVVVGDGPVRPALQASIASHGLSERIQWLGRVPFTKLPELHRSFDVEIAPVLADTFGSGSVHAISAGTPVVGYGIGAIPTILRHEAAIAIPGSSEDLASRVVSLLDDGDLHAEVHAMQLAHVEANFDVPIMNRRYHELFARIVRDEADPGSA